VTPAVTPVNDRITGGAQVWHIFGSHIDYQFRPIRMKSHLNEITREQTFVKITLIISVGIVP